MFVKKNLILVRVGCCLFKGILGYFTEICMALRGMFSVSKTVFGLNRFRYTDTNFETKVLLKMNIEFWN